MIVVAVEVGSVYSQARARSKFIDVRLLGVMTARFRGAIVQN